jgi:hypothetical protein
MQVAAEQTNFPKGTWSLQAYGGYLDDVSLSNEKLAMGAAGVGYYFADDWSLSLEGIGYGFDATNGGGDAAGGGFGGALRWHFLQRDRFSLFAEIGGGMLYADEKFPPGGTQFNFSAQAGFGATYRLDEHLHLLGGVRYLHVSNANIHGLDENPSIDAIGGYVGVSLTF